MHPEFAQNVIVTKIEAVTHKSIRAFACIRIGQAYYNKMRVVQGSSGRLFVFFHKDEVEKDDGTIVYDDICGFHGREETKAIETAVLAAYTELSSPQKTFDWLGCGEMKPTAKAEVPCDNPSRKRWSRKAPAKKAATNDKHAGRQVFGDCLLPNDDISDVGTETGSAPDCSI